MLRVDRAAGAVTLVSRLARPRVLAVLTTALLGAALAARGPLPALAAGLAASAVLVAALGGRSVRARFERGRVAVAPAVPLQRRSERALREFSDARVETVAEARRRKADLRARAYRERSGVEIPTWLRPPDAPGANDHLRRIVLVPRSGEPLAVTAWLADEDLEPVRAELATLVRAS
jgi:hypothetical protein